MNIQDAWILLQETDPYLFYLCEVDPDNFDIWVEENNIIIE